MVFEQSVYVRRRIVGNFCDIINCFYLCQVFIYELQNVPEAFVFAHLYVNIIGWLIQYTKYFNNIGVEVVLEKRIALLFEDFFN